MLVSRNSRLGFRVLKLDLFESIRLPDLNKEDRRASSLLAGYHLVSNINFNQSINLFKVIAWDWGCPQYPSRGLMCEACDKRQQIKDRSFQRYLVLDILTNPDRVTLTKKVKFWGKICYQFHCLLTTLWRLNLSLS